MSLAYRVLKIVTVLLLFFVIVLFLPISNDVNFTRYKIPSSPTYSKGENILNNGEKLYEGFIRGPENFFVYNDEIYITAHGGWIYKLNQDQIIKYIKTGQDCNDEWWEEAKCGRPLGLAIDSSTGIMYVADAYYGILTANLSAGSYDGNLQQLVYLDEPIEGKSPKLPNALTISSSGLLYWTDSSSTHHLYDGLMTILADGDGRLLKLNLSTGESTVLMDNLAFANGVALSKDESFVIVAETSRSRVLKYHLKGPKSGTSEIFLENLPGFPDNIHLNKDGHFIISLMCPFEPGQNLMDKLENLPHVRKFFYKLLKLTDVIFKYLNNLYPHFVFAYMEHWIGHLEMMNIISGKGVKIIFADENGDVKRIIYSDDGSEEFKIKLINGESFVRSGQLKHSLASFTCATCPILLLTALMMATI